MKIVTVYASNAQMPQILPNIKATGATVKARNPKYFAAKVELCDEVVIAPGSPYAEAIVATYQAKGIPVRVYGESEPMNPPLNTGENTKDDQNQGDNQGNDTDQNDEPSETSPHTSDEFNAMVERGVKALWGRARSKSIPKEVLRQGITERGLEAVAKELGIKSTEELSELLDKATE